MYNVLLFMLSKHLNAKRQILRATRSFPEVASCSLPAGSVDSFNMQKMLFWDERMRQLQQDQTQSALPPISQHSAQGNHDMRTMQPSSMHSSAPQTKRKDFHTSWSACMASVSSLYFNTGYDQTFTSKASLDPNGRPKLQVSEVHNHAHH
jgi:hypothetical protein